MNPNIQKVIIFLLGMATIVAVIRLVDWIIERSKKKKAKTQHAGI